MSDTVTIDAAFAGLEEAPSRILRAAVECMRQFGSSRMSMADVAKTSGYSRATVYKYFNNRQELIDAVIDLGRKAFFADLEETARGQSTLPEQMAAAVLRLMKYLHDDANYPWAGMLDPLDEAMITRQLGEDLIDSLAQFCTRLVSEASARGEIRGDVAASQAGQWLARVLFTSHYARPTARELDAAQDLIRGLCKVMAV